MKVKQVVRAVRSVFRFLARKAVSFARNTAAVFHPSSQDDAFLAYYGKGGTFDAFACEQRYARRQHHGRRRRGFLTATLMTLAAMLLCTAVLWVGDMWKIKALRVDGCVRYSPHAVIAASEVSVGDAYLGADAWDVARRVRRAMPLLKDVKVEKRLNGMMVITVSEHASLLYTQFHENYYAIDPDGMEVLDVASRGDLYRSMGALYVGLPEDARIRVGEPLTYAYAPYVSDDGEEAFTYEVEHQDPVMEYAYVAEVMDAVMAWTYADRVTGMELSDRYAMYLIVDGRIRVSLGKRNDLSVKLTLAAQGLSRLADGEGAVHMDVSDGLTVSVREDVPDMLPDWAKNSVDS